MWVILWNFHRGKNNPCLQNMCLSNNSFTKTLKILFNIPKILITWLEKKIQHTLEQITGHLKCLNLNWNTFFKILFLYTKVWSHCSSTWIPTVEILNIILFKILSNYFKELMLYHVFEFRKLHIQRNLWSTVWKKTFFSYIAFMSHSYRLSFSQKEIKLKCHFHSFLLKFGRKLKQNQLCFCCELHSL